ncbi:MAG: hypothetical protein D6723_10040 [Acidobacteria bacterium]|nr:MAG: hypothetical protein D6723_10040 [Acidobacteriota bacterium]
MKTLLALCTLWMLTLAGCQKSAATRGSRSDAEDDIREAVFRYQFQHNHSGLQQQADAYCLSFGRPGAYQDPPDAFLKRFRDHVPPVRRASQCEISPPHGVIDKATGGKGLIFWIATIRWVNDEEVEVEGGYYEAGTSASGNLYRVVREHGRWVVKQDKLLWIS